MRCGKKKVWLDPNEINEIANTNSRKFSIFFNFFLFVLDQGLRLHNSLKFNNIRTDITVYIYMISIK